MPPVSVYGVHNPATYVNTLVGMPIQLALLEVQLLSLASVFVHDWKVILTPPVPERGGPLA